MKNIIYLSMLLMLLAVPASAMQLLADLFPAADTTREKAGLHGPVRQVREFTVNGGILTEEHLYDTAGQLVEETFYHPNTGKLLWKHQYSYDDAGHLLDGTSSGENVELLKTYHYDGKRRESEQVDFDKNGAVESKIQTTVDAQGHIFTQTAYWRDVTTHQLYVSWKDQFRYDAHGNEIESSDEYPTQGKKTTSVSTYVYAPNGQILRHETKWSDHSQRLEVFNTQGKQIEFLYVPPVSPPGVTLNGGYSHQRSRYDEKGAQTEESMYDAADNLLSRTTFSYTLDGRLQLKRIYDGKGELREKIVYRYEGGQEQEERTYIVTAPDKEDLVQSTAFKYDEHGRLTEKTRQTLKDVGVALPIVLYPNYPSEQRWTYDSHGNETRAPFDGKYVGAGPVRREISYY